MNIRYCLTTIVFAITLISILSCANGDTSTYSAQPTSKPTPKVSTDSQCLRDASCAAKRSDWKIDGFPKCFRHIENQARYDYDWTAGVNSRFSVVELSSSFDYVKYIGTQARFQNQFGAWQRVKYVCSYDPINERVLQVDVVPHF